jgi:hypothetical protein
MRQEKTRNKAKMEGGLKCAEAKGQLSTRGIQHASRGEQHRRHPGKLVHRC